MTEEEKTKQNRFLINILVNILIVNSCHNTFLNTQAKLPNIYQKSEVSNTGCELSSIQFVGRFEEKKYTKKFMFIILV